MVKLVNATTKAPVWVADERVEEYKAAGYKLAATLSPVKEPAKVEKVEPVKEPVKKLLKAKK
jgi:hypothetical protein